MAVKFSDRVNAIKSTVTGDILKLTEQPDMISFAGGLPAEETFPKEEIKKAAMLSLEQGGEKALQYGISAGFLPLRQKIAKRMNSVYKTDLNEENILMTNGSQQALDLIGRLFCNHGDTIVVEKPTYLGAIMAFNLTEVNYQEVDMDQEGMDIAALEKALQENDRIRLIYVITDFQNPTGLTWSLSRRKAFMEIVNKYEIPVIEDNPYGELRFHGEFLPSLKALDTKGLVLSLGTFSKTFAPGMRLGWIAASKELIGKCDLLKQGMDLSTAPFTMRVANAWLENFDFEGHVASIRELYKKRGEAMIKALETHLPEGFTFTKPDGGLFCWVTMPKHMNSLEILKICIDRKVAFVPGDVFFASLGNSNYFRLNYSCSDEATIEEGIKRVCQVLKENI